ncbi:MAG TPA: hypothetical protein VFD27_16595 [Chthoniobacteraceae bacterium]|jgi:hypothetical protein|nr:hypothetical protein [Chthoniobacteraceae bacterium]
MSASVAMIKEAIEVMHHCAAHHIGSEPVAELHNKLACDGLVEIFQLVGHPNAKWCYAWIGQEDGQTQVVHVLHLPPIDSPEAAVKSVLAEKAKKTAPNESVPTIVERAREDAPDESFPVIE